MQVNHKLVLSVEQKLYLCSYYHVSFSYIDDKLELLCDESKSGFRWALTNSRRKLGHWFSDHTIEELTSEYKVTFDKIYNNPEIDEDNILIGTFYINNRIYEQITIKQANKSRKPDIRVGANYYYDVQNDIKYVIVRGRLY